MSATDWVNKYPHAIIDEVQKTPRLIETIKAAYDMNDAVRYILLGSSQILLLEKVRESLAGRAAIEELWPLTLCESVTRNWDSAAEESRLIQWLREGGSDIGELDGIPAGEISFSRSKECFDNYLQYGGMPAIIGQDLEDEEKRLWLQDYQRTYLERDVTDLAAFRDLEPFITAQKTIAGRTGRQINYSDLARVAGVTPNTAQRFMRYLELSYQVLLIRPYFRNTEKQLSKTPKIHMIDPGVGRAISRRWGEPTGEEFESAVVSEIFRQFRNARIPVEFYHLRTHDGREVDLLIELEAGFMAFEIKLSQRISRVDARHLRGLTEILDRPLLCAFLLSRDSQIHDLGDGITAMPVAWLLGTK